MKHQITFEIRWTERAGVACQDKFFQFDAKRQSPAAFTVFCLNKHLIERFSFAQMKDAFLTEDVRNERSC